MVEVTITYYAQDKDEYENMLEHYKDDLKKVGVECPDFDDFGGELNFGFQMPKYQADRLRMLLKVVAGLDTPLNNRLGMEESKDDMLSLMYRALRVWWFSDPDAERRDLRDITDHMYDMVYGDVVPSSD